MPTIERRSAMFFETDVIAAAETAAFSMECHGLTPEQVQALADDLGDAIRDFIRQVREAVPEAPERVWRCETCDVIAVPSEGQPCWDAHHPHVVVKPDERTLTDA